MPTFNWFPGHMNKTLKTIGQKLPAVDLVIEIVDARAPQSSVNPTLHRLVGHKPILTLLSKSDWADPVITQRWLAWYQAHQQPMQLLNYQDRDFSYKLIRAINHVLATKLERWERRGIRNPQVNVLVIGVPNVGKSTFINHLLKRHKAITANRPGVTRGLQIIQLNRQINLIDSPGVLPAKLTDWMAATNLVAINSFKGEVYPVAEVGSSIIERLYSRYPQHFQRYYHISPNLRKKLNANELFTAIAHSKGHVISEGFDWEGKVIRPFLTDLALGKLKISFEWPEV